MSAERRSDLAIDWANSAGVGESLCNSEGMREDSAPVVETEPISSWLKRAMQLTFPSRGKRRDDALSDNASTAANLEVATLGNWCGFRSYAYEDTRLSIRGLKMNSLFSPPSTDGCVS